MLVHAGTHVRVYMLVHTYGCTCSYTRTTPLLITLKDNLLPADRQVLNVTVNCALQQPFHHCTEAFHTLSVLSQLSVNSYDKNKPPCSLFSFSGTPRSPEQWCVFFFVSVHVCLWVGEGRGEPCI